MKWEQFFIPSKLVDGKDSDYYYIRIPDGEFKGSHYLCPLNYLWCTRNKLIRKMSFLRTNLFLIETKEGYIYEMTTDAFIKSFNRTHQESIPKLYGGLL